MREYLFRGKRKDNGEWAYGFVIKTKTGMCEILYQQEESPLHTFMKHEVIPETIGQYTGLEKDKQKIFEDDLISHGNGKYLYVVKFEDGKFVGYHAIKKEWGKWGDLHRLFDLDFKGFDWSIAGNIHDNTELLTTTTNT